MTWADSCTALETAAKQLAVPLSAGQATALLSYLGLIAKWTNVYNLTAVRDPSEMMTHHLLDSLAVIAPLTQRMARGTLLDVG